MAMVAEQQRDPVTPEAVAQLLTAAHGAAQVAMHQGGGDGTLGAAGEDCAAVEVGGVDRGRLTLGKRGARGQPWPALREGPGGGAERGRPLRRWQGGPASPGRRHGGGPARDPAVEPGEPQAWLALDPGELGGADGPGELPVAAAMTGDQANPVAPVEVELGTDDRADPGSAGRLHEADGAVQTIAIAQSERLDPQRGGAGHQGARRRRPFEEGEVRTRGELSERCH